MLREPVYSAHMQHVSHRRAGAGQIERTGMRQPNRARLGRAVPTALLLVALALPLSACSGGQGAPDSAQRSVELTAGQFPEKTPPAPVLPPPPKLDDPKTAVYSYLLWISYAYRVLDSDVATHAFSEYEEVRVNSYVELNRQNSRAIDQRLVDFKITGSEEISKTAWRVTAVEDWRYRYIDIGTVTYSSPAYSVTYDTTYTVVQEKGKGWVVDRVEAAARGGEPK